MKPLSAYWCGIMVIVGLLVGCETSDPPPPLADRHPDRHLPSDTIVWDSLFSIGDGDAFGSLDAVAMVGGDRIAILDGMNRRVSLYGRDGRLLSLFGAKGRGPGEFFNPGGLVYFDGEILVLDTGNQRLTALSPAGDSLVLIREARLAGPTSRICAVKDQLFVLSHLEGNILHRIDREGEIQRSFGKREDGDDFLGIVTAMGDLACSESGIAVLGLTTPEVLLFSLEGFLLWRDTVPDYQATIYERSGRAVRPRLPAAGYAHQLLSLHWWNSRSLLVQLTRAPAAMGFSIEDRIFVQGEGWKEVGSHTHRVLEISEELVLVAEENPFPTLRGYRVR